jgi:hypothetical protein
MKPVNIVAAYAVALTTFSAYASNIISALPGVISSTTVRLDIPTNRPNLLGPNVCSDKCDPYYKDCVLKKCLPSDSVDKINQCKQFCLLKTCQNGYFLAAVGYSPTFN